MADRGGDLAPIGVHLPARLGQSPPRVWQLRVIPIRRALARSRAVPRILPRRHRPRRRRKPPDWLDGRRGEAAGANRYATCRTARDAGNWRSMTAVAVMEVARAVTILEQPLVRFGPEIAADLDAALRREWLVTNGLGGYASGTLAGINTWRYHGLLVAALNPPVDRTILVAGSVDWVQYDGHRYPLSTH